MARAECSAAEGEFARLRGPRGLLARRIVAAWQSHAAHLDDAALHLQRVLTAVRAALLDGGRRLTAAGGLQKDEDVFYLKKSEVWAVLVGVAPDVSEKIAGRRAARAQSARLAPPASIPPSDNEAWARNLSIRLLPRAQRVSMVGRGIRTQGGRRVLVGWPASPGRTRGVARVVTGPADSARFQAGAVLVAHATSPIWTPLLSLASAAVTEVGGPVAHASIIAREFGIPLVDGALDATRVIADGPVIVVDGSTGIVELDGATP